MSATTQTTTEGTTPVVAASPVATPAASPADIAALAADPVAFEQALAASGTNLAELDSVLATPSAKPAGYAGKVPEAVTPPPAASAPAAAPTVEAKPGETPAATTPNAAPTEGEDPQPEKLGRFRNQARNFKHAELLSKFKDTNIDEVDAIVDVYGAKLAERLASKGIVATPAPAAKPSDGAPAPVAVAKLDEINARIADITTKLAKAQEDADMVAITDLSEQRVMARLEIAEAKKEAAAAARQAEQSKANEAQNTFRQREDSVWQGVLKTYPQFGDTANFGELQRFIDLKRDDPDYASIFQSPLRSQVLAREFAEAKGWNKAPAPAPAQGTPAPTPGAAPAPRVTAAEVLTPGATQGGASITAETFVQDVTKMSLRDLDAILAAAR